MDTQKANKETVARFNKEFIEGGNMRSFEEIIDNSFINHTAPDGVPKGPEGVIYFFNQILRPAFPDLKVIIHDQVAEENKVTTRKSLEGTHEGVFLGIQPTRKKVVIDVIDIIQLNKGKFTDHWNILDWNAVIRQLS